MIILSGNQPHYYNDNHSSLGGCIIIMVLSGEIYLPKYYEDKMLWLLISN